MLLVLIQMVEIKPPTSYTHTCAASARILNRDAEDLRALMRPAAKHRHKEYHIRDDN